MFRQKQFWIFQYIIVIQLNGCHVDLVDMEERYYASGHNKWIEFDGWNVLPWQRLLSLPVRQFIDRELELTEQWRV